ncbi:MAG: hypothetical protein AAF772_04020 [Acidobacteriota bacterium]
MPIDDSDLTFDAELARAFALDPSATNAPIPVERLLAYHRGQLTDDEAEQVREQLAASPESADLLLALARFEADDAPISADEARAADDAWVRLHDQLDAQSTAAAIVPPPVRRATGWRRQMLPLAASLLLAVGLGVWALSLQQTVDALRAAQTGAPAVVALETPSNARGSADAPSTLSLAAHEARSGTFLLTIVPLQNPSLPKTIEIVDAQGTSVWSIDDAKPILQKSPVILLQLPTARFAPGVYEVRLRDARQQIDVYTLRVTA